jgi:hypothetical protein
MAESEQPVRQEKNCRSGANERASDAQVSKVSLSQRMNNGECSQTS